MSRPLNIDRADADGFAMVSVPRRRGPRVVGLIGFLAAVACPILIWHDMIAKLGAGFRLDPGYLLAAWSGFALMAFGLIALVPVVWSAGGNPASRFYPRHRNALAGCATSFYLLGLALVVQLAAIVANS